MISDYLANDELYDWSTGLLPMHNLDRKAILAALPTARLRRFAELLGWRGLRLNEHQSPEGLILWFATTDLKFNLHINPAPQGQAVTFEATVVAERYGFAPLAVGFHAFRLDSEADVQASAERLAPLLSRQNFKNREWRKRFNMGPSLPSP